MMAQNKMKDAEGTRMGSRQHAAADDARGMNGHSRNLVWQEIQYRGFRRLTVQSDLHSEARRRADRYSELPPPRNDFPLFLQPAGRGPVFERLFAATTNQQNANTGELLEVDGRSAYSHVGLMCRSSRLSCNLEDFLSPRRRVGLPRRLRWHRQGDVVCEGIPPRPLAISVRVGRARKAGRIPRHIALRGCPLVTGLS